MCQLNWETITLEELKTKLSNRFDYVEKPKSDDYCGLYFHAGSKPFTLEEHDVPIRSFRATSRYSYPLFLFYNTASGGEIDYLLKKYDNIRIIPIDHMKRIQDYDDFIINKLFQSLDAKYNKTVTIHSDGFFLNPGWEDFLEAHDFDYIGAPWCGLASPRMLLPHAKDKYPVTKRTGIGNGGFCYRKRDKCLEVTNRINGIDIDWECCADDTFYSYFGFGLGIFQTYDIKLAYIWSSEPFMGLDTYGFHNTMSRMNDIISGKLPGKRVELIS